MKQSDLTILTPIDAAGVDGLDTLLNTLGEDVTKQTALPFDRLDLLHFASWVILQDDTFGAQLLFESNFDGTAELFIDQLVAYARTGLDQIYRFCPGYPGGGDAQAVCQYLLDQAVPTDTFYVGCVGLSRRRIVAEERLREKIEDFLDTLPPGDRDAAAARSSIQNFVRGDAELQWAQSPPDDPSPGERIVFWIPPAIAILAILAVVIWICEMWGWMGLVTLVAALAAAALILYLVLVSHEKKDQSVSDQPIGATKPANEHVLKLTQVEDRRPQNHLSSVTQVKLGPFRFFVLKTVLAAINLAGRYYYNKGQLGGIPSIHFARWAVINRGKQLLFLSNFDGSWEHYLGEFVDQAARGLTAVWSNSVGFPRTNGLFKGGATDEQRFKAYARNSQVPTQLWYSAYPFLSVGNILNNAQIREKLWGEIADKTELEAWLRRF
jgi:hypothetical protein